MPKDSEQPESAGAVTSTRLLCGVELINLERRRQLHIDEYDASHDDRHEGKELAENAKECLQSYVNGVGGFAPCPWNDKWKLGIKHNRNPKRLLMIAGALIAAELDRMLRAEQDYNKTTQDPAVEPTLDDLKKQCRSFVNSNGVAMSLLYDLDLLPEQVADGSKDEWRMLNIVQHLRTAKLQWEAKPANAKLSA